MIEERRRGDCGLVVDTRYSLPAFRHLTSHISHHPRIFGDSSFSDRISFRGLYPKDRTFQNELILTKHSAGFLLVPSRASSKLDRMIEKLRSVC